MKDYQEGLPARLVNETEHDPAENLDVSDDLTADDYDTRH